MPVQDTIPEHNVLQFKDNLIHALQQQGSVLRMCVDEDSYTGEGGRAIDRIGKAQSRKKTDRDGDTPILRNEHEAVWVYPDTVEWGDLIDREDLLKKISDPTNRYSEAAKWELGRQIDELILDAVSAPMKTGKLGAGTSNFPPANTFDVQLGSPASGAADQGLNISKLKRVRTRLKAEQVDPREPIYMAITAQQEEDLLGEIEVTSMDFQSRPVMEEGNIKRFLGINFVHSELVRADSNGHRLCPAWVKSGLHLGVWNDLFVEMAKDPGKRFNTRAYAAWTMGATRTDNKKVLVVPCEEPA